MMPVGVRSFLGLFGVTLVIAPADAQQPAARPPAGALVAAPVKLERGTEHKLLVQLAECLQADTFPDVEPDDKGKLPSSGQIKTFVEERRKLVDNIRVRIRDRSFNGSLDLADLYDDYKKVLAVADKHADEIRKHELRYFNLVKQERERLELKLRRRNLMGTADLLKENSRAVFRTMWLFGSSYDPWSNVRGFYAGTTVTGANIIAANLNAQADYLLFFQQTKEAMRRLQDEQLPILESAIRAEQRAFADELRRERPGMQTRGRKAVDAMTKEFNWNPLEVTFEPFAGELKSNLGPVPKMTRMQTIGSDRQALECERLARSILDVVDTLPTGENKVDTEVYSRIRADLALLAGMKANQAARYQLGEAGFVACVRSPIAAGETAVRAFKTYSAQLPRLGGEVYPKAVVRHQQGLALAYAGQSKQAFGMVNDILQQDLGGMSDPQFYYDCARIRCLGDNDAIVVAMKYLNAAFAVGFSDTEKARLSPDLKLVRDTNPKLFENAIKVFK